jgi:hypothetical protein
MINLSINISMSTTQLQTTTNFGVQNWQAIYQTFNDPDLASYDFETLRESMIAYLKKNNPENFNDYINNSEFVTLVDLIAYMGQAMSYRFDLNARESFLSTAQTRNAINSLANLVNYTPSRNRCANGYLKFSSISINEDVYDSFGNNLNGIAINWNDSTNRNWQDQWNSIINAVLISSQAVGSPGNTQLINGINYFEYSLACAANQNSPYPFVATIDNSNMNFEIVNPTSIGESYIYEVDPNNSTSTFNLLYENDSLGFSSVNTGYFLYFKQGTLSSQAFSINDTLPNTVITLTATGVNNSDVWLYQVNSDGSLTEWTQVPAIYGENIAFNNLPSTTQTIFSISNGNNDSISLVFGDGVFGSLPKGNFICFTRSSNGLTYRINPSEMSNIIISISYNSKTNRSQTLTVRANLQYTIGNSAATETLSNIKLKAPQSYYSQNRMVNGQDYNSFPFTQYSNILQIKAVNRTSSGVSRYLDVIDPTGKYSSTNIFCNDGYMYIDSNIITNNYSFTNLNILANIIETQIAAIIASSSTLNFIYNNYSQFQQANSILTQWNMVLTDNTSCSGWFGNISLNQNNSVMTINDSSFGNDTTSNASILVPGALLCFIPPSGFVFDNNNNLIVGNTSIPGLNQKSIIYSTISGTPINDGIGNNISMNGANVDGTGAIQLSQKIPTGAILYSIYPFYSPILPSNILQNIINYLAAGKSVALQYNPYLIGTGISNCWNLITSPTFPLNFNPATYGSTFIPPSSEEATSTNSWLLAFVPSSNNNSFIVYQQNNAYYFGSQQQTSFYYDSNAKIYDPINATTLSDQITILKTNSTPGVSTNLGLTNDVPIDIFSTVSEINGSIDSSRVGIQYADLSSSGIPSNPSFFTDVVGKNPAANNNYIFFVTDNSQGTTSIIPQGAKAVVIVATPSIINNNLYSYANGAIIFCTSNQTFYKITRTGNIAVKSTLNNAGDAFTYTYYAGRQDLKFQYQHNAADSRRIDPSPVNLIDIYILEQSYATAYQQWIVDTTGKISEPTPPTPATLSNDFTGLNNYKMVSDELIFNSAQFVPLFGAKASSDVQATFVVIANPNTSVSSGEIASQVITEVNNYFAIGNFSFGQTFYWSQLNNYILTKLNSLISSIHLVPNAGNLSYGALEQITCNPYEIFINCATVQNVSVVSSLNNLNLRINQ